MKKLLLVFSVIFGLGILGWYWFSPQGIEPILSSPHLPSFVRQPAPVPNEWKEKQATLPPLEGVDGNFLQSLKAEALKIDSVNVNAEEAEQKARAQVDAMGEKEIEFLAKFVTSEGASGPERIYSIYLLDMAGDRAWGALREVALTPLKERMAAPHTMEEVKSMQEKALVYMAVDALAEQAKENPRAREELERWASEARSPEVRGYILDRLKELSSQTPVGG